MVFARIRGLFLLAFAALVGCGSASGGAFAGAVSSSDLALAVVEEGGVVTAYACGGEDSFASSSRWFHGAIDGDGFSMEADGWSIEGTTGERATGTLTAPDGTARSFELAAGEEGSAEGLYAANDAGCRTGVVVWGDGSGEPRVQGTWCDDQDHYAQVTPVLPIDPSSGGLKVRVDLTGIGQGVRELFATAATAH